MMDGPSDVTSSGLSLFTVRQIMADRVTVWADRKHAERLKQDVIRTARIRRSQLGMQAFNTRKARP